MEPTWINIPARVIQGHRVASGSNDNPLFPGGTIKMQQAAFRELGLDLGGFYNGTLNVSISPLVYRVVSPKLTFRNVKWHPSDPPEDFSFFDVRLPGFSDQPIPGLVYLPHPETKTKHFQAPDTLELLFPFVDGLQYGLEIQLQFPEGQILFENS